MSSRGIRAAATLIATSVMVLAGSTGIASSASKSKATNQAVQRALTEVMKQKNGPPGISMLITRNGNSQYYGRGIRNLSSKKPVARGLHFRIASVAKTFNGAVALSLVQQGRLHLNDTIGELLPGLLPKANEVTLAETLNHTAGLPDYIRDPKFIKVLQTDPGQYLSPRKLVSYVKNTKLNHKPGTKYEYSDTDNIVAGLMAEKVTGLSYNQLLRRQIGRRVNISSTTLPDVLALPKPFLSGYDVSPGDPVVNQTFFINPALAWASGGIVSTLPDLGRFIRAYVGGRFFGNRIKRVQRQWVPNANSSPPGPGVNSAGMALFRYRSKCGTVYGHTGSFPGYRIFAASSANGKRSITFVANAQITDTSGSKRVSSLIRKMQVKAVCHALS